jgi:hypothetical protein
MKVFWAEWGEEEGGIEELPSFALFCVLVLTSGIWEGSGKALWGIDPDAFKGELCICLFWCELPMILKKRKQNAI